MRVRSRVANRIGFGNRAICAVVSAGSASEFSLDRDHESTVMIA